MAEPQPVQRPSVDSDGTSLHAEVKAVILANHALAIQGWKAARVAWVMATSSLAVALAISLIGEVLWLSILLAVATGMAIRWALYVSRMALGLERTHRELEAE